MFGKSWRRLAPLAVLPALLLAACGGSGDSDGGSSSSDTIKVGLLHSLSGTMAISEVTVRDSELLAIEEINKKGGVLGKQLEPVVEDGASDWPTFAEKAKKLITQDEVATVFGGWTSASRKAMLPVFEGNKALLWYPVQYEGLEQSPYIFYTGATTNQQIVPALDYLAEEGKKKVFLVGSDYVFPRTANKIIKAYAEANGMEILGEEYLPLGSTEVSTIVNKVQQAKPDVVFNTLNGDSNVAFFKQLKSAGIGPDQIPTMSVSIAEEEVKAIGTEYLSGHYVAWNYYQTTDTPANKTFVEAFKAKYGSDKVTSDPMEAGYNAVYLWAAAVEKAGTTDVEAVKKASDGIVIDLPEGKVTIDGATQHVYKTARIGLIGDDGQIKEVWASDGPIKPDPFLKGADYPWASGLSS
ncbi:urea ABC transporter substrate-binding protein [Frankia sp. CNm7]|uniref:Urea ABC transporter substrate-binding protein n=1 Tax=Frankia nepalensis TaxID=1836974 RepID=A0A937UQH1_9ACTN|nr:urea ABC transporter substrate-binding protein [Frankia nepalensis]MBL7496440.1 urea ABC transporter substrate-binding protein [Frankia nepalensis]MBL7512838.1 urea ABC transporter substrate-binding protein [Frankia nepalensis]MBL7522383.1 urea ABC transporter substrate-binding protein [Frankia nepalensis]MBL7630227.1 urea ABC transporter substrate-binding protein [Frankia nepalensis]